MIFFFVSIIVGLDFLSVKNYVNVKTESKVIIEINHYVKWTK